FIYHDGWRWASVKPPHPIPGIDVYRLTRGSDQMYVFRDTAEWNADPDNATVYAKLAASLRTENIPDLSVFAVRQTPPKAPFTDLRAVQRDVLIMASESSICMQKITLDAVGWYATFRQSGCDPRPPHLSGGFDDTSLDIEYSGLWTSARLPGAANGTLSFSNVVGSAARLSFKGTEITWVCSKAFNRGIAEVRVDGVSQGEVDLYSPKIEWQSRRIYGNLAPGRHTFEVIATGRKRAAATDRYVDVDALIVR
ncbi:MAG TPA: hypothetical protein VHZ74_20705, partial [Bryobacteraceae bacterium]|nr:hypothetical protein [Bryobacteraceae bacterium]